MSQLRACIKFKATDGNWYLQLGNFEYAFDIEDCTMYGPFTSESQIDLILSSMPISVIPVVVKPVGIEPPPKNPVEPSHRNMRKYY